ncbi:MAG: hypothetical protein ABFD92_06100 [Planctomycetaceae bacterium]|nr:hypothetical protein [Planctomycetaceae bacterium]
MLRVVRTNVVASTDGFEVRVRYGSPHRLEYEEEDGHLFVLTHDFGRTAEGEGYMIIYPEDAPTWEPPYEEEMLPESKTREIYHRIESALSLMKIPYQFEETPGGTVNGTRWESAEGYSVEILSENKVIYMEADHTIVAQAEVIGPSTLALTVGDFYCWQPPHENETLGEQHRLVILHRVMSGTANLKVSLLLKK